MAAAVDGGVLVAAAGLSGTAAAATAGLAGVSAGFAGLTAGYVVQKWRLHCGHSQNCWAGHGSSGAGSVRSIWAPHRWQRTLTSGWFMARQIVVFRTNDSQPDPGRGTRAAPTICKSVLRRKVFR